MSTNIGAMMIKIQIDDSKVGPKLTSIRQAMKIAGAAGSKDFESIGKSSESAMDRSAKQSKVMAGLWQVGLTTVSQIASKVFNKVTSNIDGAVKRVDTLNNFPKVMQNFGISGLEASKMIKQLDIGVKGLPTSLNDIASLAQSFVPVTKNTEMATKTSLALNNALLAGGAVEQVRTAAMEQFRQALAKGRPEMEDWKALETAMPAQLQQTAKALGLGTGALSAYSANGQGLYKAMKAGKITMDDFNNAMIKLNETGLGGFPSFAEQAKNATGGLQTSIANATTAITRGIGDIIQAIGTDVLGAAIGDSGKRFESVMKSIAGWIRDNHDAILKWVNTIKSNAIPALTSFGAAMTAIKGLKIADSLTSDNGKMKEKLTSTFEDVAKNYLKLIGVTKDNKIFDKYDLAELKPLQKVSLGIRTVTKLITGVSFGPVTAGVIGVVSALTFLQAKFNIFGKLGKLIGDGLGKLKEVAGPAISAGLKTLGSIIDGVGKAIGGFASGIASGFGGVVKTVEEFISNFTSGFSGVGKTAGEFASGFGKILKDVSPAFKPMVESFKTLFKTLGDSFNKIVQSIVKAFAPLMPAFAKLFGAIGKIFEQIFKVGSIIVTLVIGVIGAVVGAVGNVLMPIISVVVSVVSTIIGVVSGIVANIIGVVAQIIAVVVGIVAIIINIVANLISVIVGIVTGIISVIIGIVTTIINIVMGVITVIVNIISTIIGVVAGIISAIIGVVGAVIAVVVGIITTIVNVVSGIIGGIVGVVSAVVNTIVAVFQGIIGVITGIFSTIANAIGSIFRGIAKTIGNIINGIVNIVKAPINFIIDGINGFIGGINKIKIPDWVPGVGGKGINLPKIPKLAVGGIVESATLAMIGESGREAVLPLDSNTGWINEVVDKLVDRMDGDKASPGGKTTINNNYEVHNDIDVELISRAQARMIRRLA
nr:MAG TPA: minor tail protein [Caudoviricetes sp.]